LVYDMYFKKYFMYFLVYFCCVFIVRWAKLSRLYAEKFHYSQILLVEMLLSVVSVKPIFY